MAEEMTAFQVFLMILGATTLTAFLVGVLVGLVQLSIYGWQLIRYWLWL